MRLVDFDDYEMIVFPWGWVLDERWSKIMKRHVWRNWITGETAVGTKSTAS